MEFLGIPSKIHKHDEEMKKKRRFLVGFFGQSPRLEFLGMLRGIFIFIILAIIFSSFWPSFGPSFPGKLRDLKGIPRNSKQIHKNDEKMKKKRRFLVGFFGQNPRLEFLGMLRGIFIFSSSWSSFVHHFGLRLVHHSWEAQRFVGNSK